jgi:hypothetical protein
MRSLSTPRDNPLERKEGHGETTKQSEGAADSGHGSVGLGGGSRRRGPRGAGGGGGGLGEGGVGSRGQVARGNGDGARGGAAGRGNDGRVVGDAGRRHGAGARARGRAGSAARDLEGERVLEDPGVLLPEDLDAVDGLGTQRLVDRPAVLAAAAVIRLCKHIV